MSEQSIEDLDLSVRITSFLTDLGVRTVGELLALPELRAPKLVAAELEAVLDELGLSFSGQLIVDAPPVAPATGDVAERWATISAWLEEHHPWVLETFRPPAPATAIAAAGAALPHPLPADYRRFLSLHDGQDDAAPMVGTCSLFPVASLAGEYKSLHDLLDSDASPGWIPIGRSARGRDFLCLDLGPTGDGSIIQLSVDFDDRPVIAPSFTALLSVFFEQLQTGEIVLEDEP